MKSPDPASLQNLNDIVLPATVGWWPLAGGWYLLCALLLIALAWIGYRSIRRWIENGYRRAALHELQLLVQDVQKPEKRNTGLRQLPVLLKRTALSVYPREQVASLSGDDWYDYLNSQTDSPAFTQPDRSLLNSISYSTGDLNDVDSQAEAALIEAIKFWLKHHQIPGRTQAGPEP
jgi:hypothetical protein